MKLITFAIPCYNSQDYMANCIESLLPGGEAVEIIIVNDGSSDNTAKIADEYAAKYPTIVKAVHQENGGHGQAVNTGLKNATGLYFKVVDSDDWVEAASYKVIMETISKFVAEDNLIDMFISNYVYENEATIVKKVMRYSFLPKDREFTWDDLGKVKKGQYILMHSALYRTDLLRECGLELPKHTFYVDNIYVYMPLVHVKKMYYIDVNFYRYYIGRDDQSVNEKVMIKRIDQQLKVNKMMIDEFTLGKTNNVKLRDYMFNYLEIITVVSSVMLYRSGTAENLKKKDQLWDYIKEKDHSLFRKLRRGVMGNIINFPGAIGQHTTIMAYKISQKIVGFN